MNGTFCEPGKEKCDGNLKYASNIKCCMGTCQKIKKESGNRKLIGWLIIGAISLFVVWFIKKKYRSAAPPAIDLLKIGKK